MSNLQSKERSSGSYPALWRFTYEHQVSVRYSVDGTGETEHSHFETMVSQYDVVALKPSLAQSAFDSEYPVERYTRKSGPEFICYVDAVVHVAKNYGGHFS